MADTRSKSTKGETWLSEHGDYLYRYALMRLRDDDLAHDSVQETLLAAWKANKDFRGDSSIRTWLVGILKHKITDQIRKQIRNRRLTEEIESDPTSSYFDRQGAWANPPQHWPDDPEHLLKDGQFKQVLMSCISKLPGVQREVFSLRELANEDSETICNACDISTTNLHVIMHRARMALRSCLENHWFKDEGSAKT